MACLRDTSDKNFGDMNYYNRENNQWYDEIIKNNFKKISRGKFPNPKDYYYLTNFVTVYNDNKDNYIMVNIENKQTIKVIFNANIYITNSSIKNFYSLPTNAFVLVNIDDSNNKYSDDAVNNKIGKRQYDGSYTFTIDVSNQDYNNYVQLQKWWGNEYYPSQGEPTGKSR